MTAHRRLCIVLFCGLLAISASAENLTVTDRPLVQRVLLHNTPSRALAVGMPEQFNYVIDSVTMTPLYVWYGGFLNLKAELSHRGGRPCSIVGDRINLKLPASPLRFGDYSKPPADLQFQGYRRVGNKPPEFLATIDGHRVSQTLRLVGSRQIAVTYEFLNERAAAAFFHIGGFDRKQVAVDSELAWISGKPVLRIPPALTRFTVKLDLSGLNGMPKTAKAVTGHSLYRQYCNACHSLDGTQLIGPTLKSLWGRKRAVVSGGNLRNVIANADYVRRSLVDPQADVAKGFETAPMPSFKEILSNGEIELLVAFIEQAESRASRTPKGPSTIVHAAVGKTGRLSVQPSRKYPAKGAATLTDGVLASTDFKDRNWLGFEGDNIDFTLDLGRPTLVESLQANLLQNTQVGIYAPEHVEFALSANGRDFQTVATAKTTLALPAATAQTLSVGADSLSQTARFVRVRAQNTGPKRWLFVDEVLVQGKGEPGASASASGKDTEGFESLFDGNAISQWRGYRKQAVPSCWKVKDETLVRVGHGGDLVTRKTYRSFDFRFDWKVTVGGNSGVMYRVSEKHKKASYAAPEYQVMDNGKYGPLSTASAGANCALHAPSKDVIKPVGMWNRGRIVVNGNHVEHWLNGERIVEYELLSAEWEKLVKKSRLKGRPDYGRTVDGRICLQDHGGGSVSYRNLRIKEL